jgi:putative toxin-antitoxin system antitoxin component (TIGR02293 family)
MASAPASEPEGPVTAKARERKLLADRARDDRLAEVLEIAIPMFGDRERAIRWLSMPKRRLGGKTPKSLLASSEGAASVIEYLRAAQYGLLS